MDSAIKIFSREGRFKKKVFARDIKSREHARKLSPFVFSEDQNVQVIWVSPVFEGNEQKKLKRKSYFRRKVQNSTKSLNYQQEEIIRFKVCSESEEHKLAKQVLSNELKHRLTRGLSLDWGFYDDESTDFLITGNLLNAATKIELEYEFKTSLGNKFRLDIAILGGAIRDDKNREFILAGIEIEKENSFDYRKEILCKSAGFPLISVDISGMSIDDINQNWAMKIIGENLKNSKKRNNYIYIHDLLYTLFIDYPQWIFESEPNHQYIIFDSSDKLAKILNDIVRLKESLLEFNLVNFNINCQNVSLFKKGTKEINFHQQKVIKNMGDIVGAGWENINQEHVGLITISRPKKGNELHFKVYMALFRLLLQSSTALIGYKFIPAIKNDNLHDDFWRYSRVNKENRQLVAYKIAPKRLVEPLEQIVHVIENLK